MIGCESMEQFDNQIDKKLNVYSNSFTNEQLQEYEDAIFTKKIDRKKRAELEIERLKNDLSKEQDVYAEYFDEIVRISKLLKVSSFDVTVLDEIYATILRIELECGLKPRLFSAIPLLMETLGKNNSSLSFNR